MNYFIPKDEHTHERAKNLAIPDNCANCDQDFMDHYNGQCPNGYVAFYAGRRAEIRAFSLLGAKRKAVAEFEPPKAKEHMVTVMLAEVAGQPVTHVVDF